MGVGRLSSGAWRSILAHPAGGARARGALSRTATRAFYEVCASRVARATRRGCPPFKTDSATTILAPRRSSGGHVGPCASPGDYVDPIDVHDGRAPRPRTRLATRCPRGVSGRARSSSTWWRRSSTSIASPPARARRQHQPTHRGGGRVFPSGRHGAPRCRSRLRLVQATPRNRHVPPRVRARLRGLSRHAVGGAKPSACSAPRPRRHGRRRLRRRPRRLRSPSASPTTPKAPTPRPVRGVLPSLRRRRRTRSFLAAARALVFADEVPTRVLSRVPTRASTHSPLE